MALRSADHGSKVPALSLGFWIIKIAATTLGETAGDAVTMSMKLGYLVGTAIFTAILVFAVTTQIRATRFHPLLYWCVVVATTTTGTTLADFADRSLGIGYAGGTAILLTCVAVVLAMWRWSCGAISADRIATPRVEMFYWATIMFSQTLGTAMGDWLADTTRLGYAGGAAVFAFGLIVIVGLYFTTSLSRTALFWLAFILTRPLGATVGDFLDKPIVNGGLDLSRYAASALLAAFILACVLIMPQRPGAPPPANHLNRPTT